MAVKPYSFRYPFNLTAVFQPWFKYLKDGYDKVVADLTERDRLLEDHLNLGVGQGYLGTASITANQAGLTAVAADIVGLSVTVTIPPHRRLKLTAHGRLQNNGAGVSIGTLLIVEGVTTLGQRITGLLPAGGAPGDAEDVDFSVFIEPTEGQHTYKVQASMSSGAGTFIAFAGNPGYLTVEDIGPVG